MKDKGHHGTVYSLITVKDTVVYKVFDCDSGINHFATAVKTAWIVKMTLPSK